MYHSLKLISADLYMHYIIFINKIHFREITAQEQGIEMYEMLQKHMRIKEDMKGLDEEVEELHTYARLKSDGESNKLLNRISTIGAIFLPISLIAGILGMNTLPDPLPENIFEGRPYFPFWASMAFIASIGLLSIVLIKLYIKKEVIGKWVWWIGGILLLTLLVFIAAFSFNQIP